MSNDIAIGQTQCQRLPHEWGLGKEKIEASLPSTKSAVEGKKSYSTSANLPLLGVASNHKSVTKSRIRVLKK